MIFDKIREILAEQLGADAEDITMETNIMKNLEADSLDVVEIIMAIEDEFEIEIPDDEIENLKIAIVIIVYTKSILLIREYWNVKDEDMEDAKKYIDTRNYGEEQYDSK